jgi:hypothetical protein
MVLPAFEDLADDLAVNLYPFQPLTSCFAIEGRFTPRALINSNRVKHYANRWGGIRWQHQL